MGPGCFVYQYTMQTWWWWRLSNCCAPRRYDEAAGGRLRLRSGFPTLAVEAPLGGGWAGVCKLKFCLGLTHHWLLNGFLISRLQSQ